MLPLIASSISLYSDPPQRGRDVIPFAYSEELLTNSGLPASALVEVGNDHRLADPEPLAAMLRVCENARAK